MFRIKIMEDEYWWGGSSAEAAKGVMPLSEKSEYTVDLRKTGNQTMPLFISSKGRYVYSKSPFVASFCGGYLECVSHADSEFDFYDGGKTLRDAYIAAMEKHFKFTGKVPPMKFFETAQYNTWMEFDYEQNQKGILEYAHAIVDNGFDPGILMIDEGWHTRYGEWEFDFTKFPDPRAMIDELHSLGFTVLLWVVPAHTPDGKEFSMLTAPELSFLKGAANGKTHFLRTDDGNVALVNWWNGFSALLNLKNPDDAELLRSKLDRLMREYGVDGFKFDGGNIASMYNPERITNGKQTSYTPEELNLAWNEFGEQYEYHEFKDTYGGGGKAVIQRLADRAHRWGMNNGLATVLPASLLQGLIGYPFICPDMIGGGSWAFNYMEGFECDQELFVRMAQCSALFPMMQFSWAPWRMLSKEYLGYCLDAAKLHKRFLTYLTEKIKESAVSGEPILRHMEYQFPNQGFEQIDDQFVLGDSIIVAPVVEKGAVMRTVVLPEGEWLYLGEVEYSGGTVTVPAPISVLPYFVRKKD